MNPILCLDFDGVIHSYTSKWVHACFAPDPPVPGAFEFIHDAIEHFEIRVFSSRSKEPTGILGMMCYIEHWAPLILGNAAPKWRGNHVINYFRNNGAFPTEKPPAFLTIDDRAFTFTGTFPTIDQIKSFKPWNKK